MFKILGKLKNFFFWSNKIAEREIVNTMLLPIPSYETSILLKAVSTALKDISDRFITTHNAKQVYEAIRCLILMDIYCITPVKKF